MSALGLTAIVYVTAYLVMVQPVHESSHSYNYDLSPALLGRTYRTSDRSVIVLLPVIACTLKH